MAHNHFLFPDHWLVGTFFGGEIFILCLFFLVNIQKQHTCTKSIIDILTSPPKKVPTNQWSGKRKWLWAIVAPSSQHSMGHFSVVFVKTKILYGPFDFCMGHLYRITKLYVSNGPWPLPFPITANLWIWTHILVLERQLTSNLYFFNY
jgi:hypothetical protein